MKRTFPIILAVTLLIFTGCDLFDELVGESDDSATTSTGGSATTTTVSSSTSTSSSSSTFSSSSSGSSDTSKYSNKADGSYVGKIHISGKYYERWVWPKDGPDYASSVLIVCDDGQKLYVPNTRRGYLIGTGGRKYVAGTPYFQGEGTSSHVTMEYYAHYGTFPKVCTVYY